MPIQFVRASGSEAETDAIGRRIADVLRPGDVLLIDGALGAGKTRLVRAIAAGLGLDPHAPSSPTFVLVHVYRRAGAPPHPGAPELVHIDAYRLRGGQDLESLGLDALRRRDEAARGRGGRADPDRPDGRGRA
jgi:tRNA threonylcarbamoyladenosine biosynthesis protein TsaE